MAAPPHDPALTGLPPAPKPKAAPPKKLAPTADKPARKPPVRTQKAPMTYAQQAAQIVNSELNPVAAQQRLQGNQQNQAIANFTKMLLQAVAGIPGQIGQGYDQAVSTQTNIANGAADALRNANPNQQNQDILNAVGAPDSQKQQVASNLADTFNGGAAVSQYRNLLNTNDLQAQKLASVNYAKTLPAIEGLRGHQALQNAIYTQKNNLAQLLSQRPKLLQDALSSIYDQAAKQQQLQLEYQALGYPDPSLSRATGVLTAKNGQTIGDANGNPQILPGFKLTAGGKVVKLTSGGGLPKATVDKINASVSSHTGRGIALDSQGKPVLINGKTIPWNASLGTSSTTKGGVKAATPSQVNTYLKTLTTSDYATVSKTNKDTGKRVSYKTQVGKTYNVQYDQAYRRLLAMGVKDAKARQYLQSIYPRGAAGRAYLTNEEQATLYRSKLPVATGVIDIKKVGERHYITAQQARVLRKAKRLPRGFWYTADQGHTVYVIKPGY